ncbi:MAG: short-chain dehydrogenase [Micavibrio aeruginosavorus]|uniref:Short-chain dehydrogenase n=1 Tax=Micavibrio aeruginosavorus TaxID=349221 RepID=A0A2W5N2H2_9BACT|nr:MAG: short-chain dehydrogenase [Micavibrio aeruginosavorus]
MNQSENGPRSILISGASSGIGEALALHYAAPGVFLAISGRNEERLEAVATACIGKGASVDVAVLSVTERSMMEDWVTEIDEEHELDLVIANAGISGGTGGVMNGESIDQARAIFDVNLYGVLNTLGPVLPRMMARGRGQIALIASLAAYRGFPGAPAYSASKGAVRFYGEALRAAVRDSGVKINVVCPGFVKSRMTDLNDFPMPFLMEAQQAACIIANGLQKDRGRIAFPFPTMFVAWLVSILPDSLAQKLLAVLPAKGVATR